jgi:hypothetical protein
MHVLHRLGISVLSQWNELPRDLQKRFFRLAVNAASSPDRIHLSEQIARFLHLHADDASTTNDNNDNTDNDQGRQP